MGAHQKGISPIYGINIAERVTHNRKEDRHRRSISAVADTIGEPSSKEVGMSSKRPFDESGDQAHVSRRDLLKSSSAAMIVAGVPGAAAAQQSGTPIATPDQQDAGETKEALLFFNDDEAIVVERLTARLLPGTPDDPGAREAGVVYYIDKKLHGSRGGYSLKTYTQGPYLTVSGQQAQPEITSRPTLYETQAVNTEELASRYGYQTVMPPQQVYKRGIGAAIAYAQSEYESNFSDLTDDQLDEMLEAMEADEADQFDAPSGAAFFSVLRNDMIEGMFSDPMYGGNRGMVGWKLIGYPGPRGFYSVEELHDPDFHASPISLAEMDDFHHR